jgi:hypothetical protein
LLEVGVQLLERHDAVAVEIRRAPEPLQRIVREETVAQLGQLERHSEARDAVMMARPRERASRSRKTSSTRSARVRLEAKCARRRPRCSRRRGNHDPLGLDPVEDDLELVHGEGRRVEVIRIRVARHQVLREPVGL